MSSISGRGNASEGPVRWIWWLRHDYGFVFDPKLTHKHRCISCCAIMVQNSLFCTFLTNSLTQLAHNFKIVFLIDRSILCQKFMMSHAIAIEENGERNLHIWPNLSCFFQLWLFWTLGWLGFGFNVIAIHPWFVPSYDLFEQTWIVIEHRQHFLSDFPATLVLLKNVAILEQSLLPHVSCLKDS